MGERVKPALAKEQPCIAHAMATSSRDAVNVAQEHPLSRVILPGGGKRANPLKNRWQKNNRPVWLGALALLLAGDAPAILRVATGYMPDEID